IQITVHNRGPESATLHLLPTLWFRNIWSWGAAGGAPVERPLLRQSAVSDAGCVLEASHPNLGARYLVAEGAGEALFTENETNTEALVHTPNAAPYVKDGINNYIVFGEQSTVNAQMKGTKASVHYTLMVEAGKSKTIRLRLTDIAPDRSAK